jgi:hypothetical protein
MTLFTKTAAIAKAAKAVSIWGSGTSWTVCGPYSYSNVDGPCTETNCTSYQAARGRAAAWRARVALSLMGKLTDEAEEAIYAAREDGIGDVRSLVNVGLGA